MAGSALDTVVFRWFAALLLSVSVHVASAAEPPTQLPAPSVEAAGSAAAPRICLVLSGGGARGAAHIGVLRVLEQMRVPIDCVVGTSMGAVIGASWASGGTPEQMESAVRDADWGLLLGDQPVRQQRSLRTKELERQRIAGGELGLRRSGTLLPVGAVIGQQLDRFLQRLLGPPRMRESFDALPVPYRAIATDIESGRMIVIDRGSLHSAARASMSVPGVFAPQEYAGRLLVDGGLVRNLGVDVARSLGATRVIAVNLGTPLSGREELGSLLGVTGQMINILTEQNVSTSLAQLGTSDILIRPELGAFSAADFAHAWTTIEIGERAARAAAPQLQSLALPPAAYERREQQRLAGRSIGAATRTVRVETDHLRTVNPDSVLAVFNEALHSTPDDATDDAAVSRAVDALYATDDFQLVSTHVAKLGDRDELVIEPQEKLWGPNYLRPGLALSTDLAGSSAVTLGADYRQTWLNRRGLEWRTTLEAGQLTAVRSELIQPIDVTRRWLAAGYVDGRQRVDEFFVGSNALSRLRSRTGRVGFEARRQFSTTAELRLGVQRSRFDTAAVTGFALPFFDGDTADVHAGLTIDRLDSWDFPQSGLYATMDITMAAKVLGGDIDYRKAEAQLRPAFGGGRHSVSMLLRHSSSLGTDLPLFDAFQLGGFQNLSGFGERQILANGLTFGRLVYAYQVTEGGTFARGIYLGGSLEAAEVREPLNFTSNRRELMAGSLFLATDTALGPFYVGAGIGEGGERTLYLFLGRP